MASLLVPGPPCASVGQAELAVVASLESNKVSSVNCIAITLNPLGGVYVEVSAKNATQDCPTVILFVSTTVYLCMCAPLISAII